MNVPALNSTLISQALNLPIPTAAINFTNLVSDSRAINKDSCFIALKGEQADGHDFIPKAIAAGATGIICHQGYNIPEQLKPRAVFFVVADTLAAFRAIAQAWRQLFNIPIVGVAGSAGKTTSKELVSALLRGRWRHVLQTQASQNGYQGIPATIMNLQPRHEAAVIEIGIDEPGAMVQHLALVNPTHGLLTSIGEEHLEKLINLATVAQEEGEIFHSISQNKGVICVNASDSAILEQSQKYQGGKRFFYGLDSVPGVGLVGHIKPDQTLVVDGLGREAATFKLPLDGRHNALNLLGAIAMAHSLGLSASEMQAGLKSFAPPTGRSELHLWRKSIRVYCDTYNANPSSMKVALHLLEKIPEGKEKINKTWACLGDMLELGLEEEAFHRNLAPIIDTLAVDNTLLCGPKMKWLADELKKKNYKGFYAHFDEPEAIASKILKDAAPQDLLLVKGSRGMRMERIWEAIRLR